MRLRKFSAVKLVSNELIVVQEFLISGERVFCGWRELNPSVVCLWGSLKQHVFVTNNLVQESVKEAYESSAVEAHISPAVEANKTYSDIDVTSIRTILSEMRTRSKSGILMNDEYFDPSDSLGQLRGLCDELCELFDSFLFIKKHCTRNMDKVLLIKLEAAWRKVVLLASKLRLCKSLPQVEWLPAIWLHVIGCPPTVRCLDDLIFLVSDVWLNKCFENLNSFKLSLTEIGFRDYLADVIAFGVVDIDFFESMLKDIAEPISWNSFLISENDSCYSVYAVENGGQIEIGGTTDLQLHVVDETEVKKTVFPLPFSLQDMNWCPGDFAEYVYQEIQKILLEKGSDYCVYGHCTSEQAIIDMSKTGLSPFATMTNRKSCGHGMYFFRMEQSAYGFKDLTNGFKEDEKDGEQFRAFVYAFSIPFVRKECHALSAAVLLFLIKKDEIDVFDAVVDKLPIVNRCKPSESYFPLEAISETQPNPNPVKPAITAERWCCHQCRREINNDINLAMNYLPFQCYRYLTYCVMVYRIVPVIWTVR